MGLDEFCSPCSRANRESRGKSWCFHCEETLCEPCGTAHLVNKVTFAHHFMSKKPTQIITSFEKLREIELTEHPEYKICHITFAANGNMLVFISKGYWEHALLFLNPKGNTLKQCGFRGEFMDITKIPGTDLQVMLRNESYSANSKIQFVDTASLHLGKLIKVDNDSDKNGYSSIDIVQDKIYLVGETSMRVMTTDGRCLDTIKVFAGPGQTINRPPYDKDGYLYLTYVKNLVKLNLQGELLFTYGEDFFSEVFGCLLDNNGYIYVGGKYHSDKKTVVQQLSPEGMLVNDQIVNFSEGPNNSASAMCFNNDFSEMYFVQKNENGPDSIIIHTCKTSN